METIQKKFKLLSQNYNSGIPHYHLCYELVKICLDKLSDEAPIKQYGFYMGKPNIAYYVAQSQNKFSRPFRKDFFIENKTDFMSSHENFIERLKEKDMTDEEDINLANKIIYTSIMSFAACYDIWRNSARKTPGTFFEILMAGLFKIHIRDAILSKHINLNKIVGTSDNKKEDDFELGSEDENTEEEKSSVSTDLVLTRPNMDISAVVPLKITTRERIVQPFAHQRILDSAYPGKYRSFLACISEVQMDKKSNSVKQVCVPGTIKLFQKYLGNMAGIYYCDVPQRYASEDLTKHIPVKDIGIIFYDIKRFLSTSDS